MAEVCRNRTDRSTKGGPTGFEVPGGHQPACTSVLILNEPLEGVNVTAASCRQDCGTRRPSAKELRRLPLTYPSSRNAESQRSSGSGRNELCYDVRLPLTS